MTDMTDLEQEMLSVIIEQHHAIDLLMSWMIQRDKEFMPSKSPVWPAVLRSSDIMKRYKVLP